MTVTNAKTDNKLSKWKLAGGGLTAVFLGVAAMAYCSAPPVIQNPLQYSLETAGGTMTIGAAGLLAGAVLTGYVGCVSILTFVTPFVKLDKKFDQTFSEVLKGFVLAGAAGGALYGAQQGYALSRDTLQQFAKDYNAPKVSSTIENASSAGINMHRGDFKFDGRKYQPKIA